MDRKVPKQRTSLVDTVTFRQNRILSHPQMVKRMIYGIPHLYLGFRVSCIGDKTYRLSHKQTGLRAVFVADRLHYVQVSLPRMLFGSNSFIICWQRQIDDAFAEVDHLLNTISQTVTPGREFTRVDLVWQFGGDPSNFYLSHRHSRHPKIHNPAVDFNNRGLEWRGTKMKILMYDKLFKEKRRRGTVTRVEVQLRGHRLRKILSAGAAITALKFEQCYSTYRNIIVGFRPKLVPVVTDVIDLIAYAQQRGIDLWPHWASRRYSNPRTLSRARKQLVKRKLKYFHINWQKLLPPNRPKWKIDLNLQTRTATKVLLLCVPVVRRPTQCVTTHRPDHFDAELFQRWKVH